MPELTNERIYNRIHKTNEALYRWRKLNHTRRRLVAGDISALTTDLATDSQAPHEMQAIYRDTTDDLHDLLVTDIEEARTNKLLQTVRTFSMQIAHVFPDIEFESLDQDEAAVNALYCKMRLGGPPYGCSARHEMRMALNMYLIDGLGAVFIGLRDGRPIVEYLDTLDMVWDLTGKVFGDIRWCAYRQRQPLYVWKELYKGEKGVNMQAFKELDPNETDQDKPVTVWQYYDVQGKGTHAVFIATTEGSLDNEPVLRKENPYMMPQGKEQVPMLPVEFMYLMNLPSVKMPESLVQQMLPDQIAAWEADRRLRDDLQTGRGLREYVEGSYDPKDLDEWMENPDSGQFLKRKREGVPMTNIPPTPMDPAIGAYIDRREQGMIGTTGMNPYASGNKVEGISYASEVNAIQGNSGLTAAAIAKDDAEFWIRTVRKFLAVGSMYDDEPITITVPGDPPLRLEFDEVTPVKEFLVPDTDIIVREDSMLFQPKEQQIGLASALLKESLAVAQLFPNAPAKAFEKLLHAAGERNVNEWLKPPPTPPGMPPGMDPGVMNTMPA